MKKIAAVFAVVALLALGGSAFAATNPFMDVPMNSWAYDAVVSLAARGVLSGYPDGLYKGKQSMTRYEAASAIARALAYIDMTKADKQDVEMLKKLVVEFKDELDALGVRVDALEADMAVFKKRLGGWEISGRLRFDLDYRSLNGTLGTVLVDESMGYAGLGDARVHVKRYFGENEDMLFHMQLRAPDLGTSVGEGATNDNVWMKYFYVKIPFFYDSFLWAGRQGDDDLDRRFGWSPDMAGRYGNFGWFNDSTYSMLKFTKDFGLGSFAANVAHSNATPTGIEAWQILANFDLKFNEQIGFGLGGQYLKGNHWGLDPVLGDEWDSTFTGWVGLDFFFTQGISAHAMGYFQSNKGAVGSVHDEGANSWRIALNFSQEVLKFTDFYAEYGRIGQHFWAQDGLTNNVLFSSNDGDNSIADAVFGGKAAFDIKYWKLGAAQQWNEKVRTWLFYVKADTDWDSLKQYGIGVDYAYNANTIFGLNYMKWDTDSDLSFGRVRFTTQVVF